MFGSSVKVKIEREYDEAVGTVEMAPQELGRALMNLLKNAFEAVYEKDGETRRRGDAERSYVPTVTVSTRRVDHGVRQTGAGSQGRDDQVDRVGELVLEAADRFGVARVLEQPGQGRENGCDRERVREVQLQREQEQHGQPDSAFPTQGGQAGTEVALF